MTRRFNGSTTQRQLRQCVTASQKTLSPQYGVGVPGGGASPCLESILRRAEEPTHSWYALLLCFPVETLIIKAREQSRRELLTAAGLRQDNRRPYELRQLEFSIFAEPPAGADGAASASHGLTRVVAVVFGPHDSSSAAGPDIGSSGVWHAGGEEGKARISVSISTTPFSSQNRKSVARTDKRNVELAVAIANTFEPAIMLGLYPRSTIDISIEVLQQDGGVFSPQVLSPVQCKADGAAQVSCKLPSMRPLLR